MWKFAIQIQKVFGDAYAGAITDDGKRFLRFWYRFGDSDISKHPDSFDLNRFIYPIHLKISEGKKIGLIGNFIYEPHTKNYKASCYITVRPKLKNPKHRIILPWRDIAEDIE